MKWKHSTPKYMGSSKSNSMKEIYKVIVLQEIKKKKKNLNKHLNQPPKVIGKRRIIKAQSHQKGRNNKNLRIGEQNKAP